MIDNYGREINYLRVSVTKRCNLNCTYCGAQCDKSYELTRQEIVKIVKAFVKLGINKVRLTGGEPLVRNDICEIARDIKNLGGIKKLAITTNGVLLKEKAQKLKDAGVDCVNISLDTTDRAQYAQLTGADCIDKVFAGIEEAQRVGLKPVRLNAVLIRGQNDDQAGNLINLARDRKIDVRFIELMPFSDDGDNEKLVIKGQEILDRFPFLVPYDMQGKTDFENSVARYYNAPNFMGRIGLITPVSEKFCDKCNRIRLLSDGKIKPCLGNNKVFDIRKYLDDEELLLEKVKEAILSKPMEHSFSCGYKSIHGLNQIGG